MMWMILEFLGAVIATLIFYAWLKSQAVKAAEAKLEPENQKLAEDRATLTTRETALAQLEEEVAWMKSEVSKMGEARMKKLRDLQSQKMTLDKEKQSIVEERANWKQQIAVLSEKFEQAKAQLLHARQNVKRRKKQIEILKPVMS